jgi:hypothetical protein
MKAYKLISCIKRLHQPKNFDFDEIECPETEGVPWKNGLLIGVHISSLFPLKLF